MYRSKNTDVRPFLSFLSHVLLQNVTNLNLNLSFSWNTMQRFISPFQNKFVCYNCEYVVFVGYYWLLLFKNVLLIVSWKKIYSSCLCINVIYHAHWIVWFQQSIFIFLTSLTCWELAFDKSSVFFFFFFCNNLDYYNLDYLLKVIKRRQWQLRYALYLKGVEVVEIEMYFAGREWGYLGQAKYIIAERSRCLKRPTLSFAKGPNCPKKIRKNAVS